MSRSMLMASTAADLGSCWSSMSSRWAASGERMTQMISEPPEAMLA